MIIEKNELTNCELLTMKILWDAEEALTCREIINQLTRRGFRYADTTVYTFLKNLQQKGFVNSYRRTVSFYYPTKNKEEYLQTSLLKFCKFWFAGDTQRMIEKIQLLK